MHVFDIRKDLAVAQLAGVMPNTSTFGLWLFLFPLWAKYKLSGTYFGYPRVPEERTEATDFEKVLQGFVDSEDMKQGESYFMRRNSVKGPFMVVAEPRV